MTTSSNMNVKLKPLSSRHGHTPASRLLRIGNREGDDPKPHPRQEGEEVVLLVVDDVPRIPLLTLLGMAQPHSTGTEVPHATTSRPRAAPET